MDFPKRKQEFFRATLGSTPIINYKDIYKKADDNVFHIYRNIYAESIKQSKQKNSGGDESILYKEFCGRKEDFSCNETGMIQLEKRIRDFVEGIPTEGYKDKSMKSSFDLLILPCLYVLNKHRNYCTTSSCSGRIIIYSNLQNVVDKRTERKDQLKNLLKTPKMYKEDLLKWQKEWNRNLSFKNSQEGERTTTKASEFLNYFENICSFDPNQNRLHQKEIREFNSDSELIHFFKKGEKENRYKRFLFGPNQKKLHKKNIQIFYLTHSHLHIVKDVEYIREKIMKDLFLNEREILEMGPKGRGRGISISKEGSFSDDESLKKYIYKRKKERKVYIKVEPFIIHVQTKNFKQAKKLLRQARIAGMKNSGISDIGVNPTVAIRGSTRLEHLLGDGINIQMNRQVLTQLFKLCNEKMTNNIEQMIQCFNYMKPDNKYIFEAFKVETIPLKLSFGSFNKKKKVDTNRKNDGVSRKEEEDDTGSFLHWKKLVNENIKEKRSLLEHTIFTHNKKIYVLGKDLKCAQKSMIQIFDLNKRESEKYSFHFPPLLYHTLNPLNYLYAILFGGITHSSNCSNRMYVYHVEKNCWFRLKTKTKKREQRREVNDLILNEYPVGRYKHGSVITKGYVDSEGRTVGFMYMYGGIGVNGKKLNDIWRAKIVISKEGFSGYVKWKQLGKIQKKEQCSFYGHTLVFYKKKKCIYIVGGESRAYDESRKMKEDFNNREDLHNSFLLNDDTSLDNRYMNTMYVYNIRKDTFEWIRILEDDTLNCPIFRFGPTICVFGKRYFFLIGGMNNRFLMNDIWVYDMFRNQWIYYDVLPSNRIYNDSKIIIEGDYLYLIQRKDCVSFKISSLSNMVQDRNGTSSGQNISYKTNQTNHFPLQITESEETKLNDRSSLCLAIRNKIIVKAIKCLLEEEGYYDKMRKIRSEEVALLNQSEKVDAFLIPLNRKAEVIVYEKEESFCQRILQKIKADVNEFICIIKQKEEMNRIEQKKIELLDIVNAFFKKTERIGIRIVDNVRLKLLKGIHNYTRIGTILLYHKKQFTGLMKFYDFHKKRIQQIDEIIQVWFILTKRFLLRKKDSRRACMEKFKQVYKWRKNQSSQLIPQWHGYIKKALESVSKFRISKRRKYYMYGIKKVQPIVERSIHFKNDALNIPLRKTQLRKCINKAKYKYTTFQWITYLLIRKYKSVRLVRAYHQFFRKLKAWFNKKIIKLEPYVEFLEEKESPNKENNAIKKKEIFYKERKRMILHSPYYYDFILFNIWKKSTTSSRKSKESVQGNGKQRTDEFVTSIAIYSTVQGNLRKNELDIMCGKDLETIHNEYGIHYKLNVGEVMFCKGNFTEKLRLINLYMGGNTIVEKENVVDLFCGIGYFSLPLLKCVGDPFIDHYFACDLNPISLKYFKESIKLNNIEKKNLQIIQQDSFELSTNVLMTRNCHRVLLGLLPSSRKAWKNAFFLINENTGGILHVHGVDYLNYCTSFHRSLQTSHILQLLKMERITLNNQLDWNKLFENLKIKKENKEESLFVSTYTYLHKRKCKNSYMGNNVPIHLHFAQEVLIEFFKIALTDYVQNNKLWNLCIVHVEKVKSYAPYMYHFVVDIKCTPEEIA